MHSEEVHLQRGLEPKVPRIPFFYISLKYVLTTDDLCTYERKSKYVRLYENFPELIKAVSVTMFPFLFRGHNYS